MSIFIERSEWRAAPPKRALTPWNPDTLSGITVHWFGSPNAVMPHTRCADLVRSVQRGHMNNSKENYSDIAYNHCVCQHGYVFECRGFQFKSGANGTTTANNEYAAACFIMGKNDLPAVFTQEGQNALKWLIRQWFKRGVGISVKKHGYWTGSECPGPTISKWVDSGEWKLQPEKESPIPNWLDDFLLWHLVGRQLGESRPVSVPGDTPEWAWEFASIVHRITILRGADRGFLETAYWKIVHNGDPAKRPDIPEKLPRLWWNDLTFLHKLANDFCEEKL